MGVTFDTGYNPHLEAYLKKQRTIEEKLWQNQQNVQFPLINLECNKEKSLLQQTLLPLEEKEYILDCWVIPTGTSTRGWHEAIEVIIYNPHDIKKIPLTFNRSINLENNIEPLARFGGIDTQGLLKERPTILPLQSTENTTLTKMITKCYSGWYSFSRIDGSNIPIAQLHKFEPHITAEPFLDNPTFMFAAQKEDNRIGWTYFPVGLSTHKDDSNVTVLPKTTNIRPFVPYL